MLSSTGRQSDLLVLGGGAELSEGTPPDVPRLCPITLMGNLDLNGRNLRRFVDLRSYTCALFFCFSAPNCLVHP